ncbi:integrase catalytic domain-containing protein [Trichonephila clavipes]|nr:integrase catalytic domain-containing protein [Trichonephila clavipes]
MYVDNCVASVDSSEELESFQRDSTELLALGKFDLRGCRHSDIESNFDFQDNQQKYDPQEIQVLGLMWNVKEDTLSISYRETESKEEVTKRRILSLAHRIFDPIGFTCHFTLIPKLLIEECWKIETSWNSKLQIDIERKFERWKNQLIEIQDIKIPRRLSKLDFKDLNLSLQVFCDANHHTLDKTFVYRFNAKPISVSEGLLPQDRVRDAAVFEIIGLDLAGHLILKNGETNWILILTCAVYGAIHLELLTSVSTESFLLDLRRFIARRGRPSVIYSDNGTNFKGAYSTLSESELRKIVEYRRAKSNFMEIFIPPQVPWWGGFWERVIGLVKRTLRKTLGRTSLNHEEMYTVLCDYESLINFRPLIYVTDDVKDLKPLTPAMFLHDIGEIGVPELDQIDENKLNKRLLYQNRIQNDPRKRFRVEHLGQLRKTRNIKGENTLSEGDIVLVGDDHIKSVNWNLDANEGSHLPINIDHELSKPERAATSSMQPCSSISNGGAGLDTRAETSGHQQAETSSMQTCSSVSDVGARVEPRLKTLELPDFLTSDGELQQPRPRPSRFGRLLKPRKGLNDYC